MTTTAQTDADRKALFAENVEALDTRDLGMIGDHSIDETVRDWGLVSHVEATPDESTVTICGDDLTMQAEIEFHFNDQGKITVPVIVKANDEDGIFGFLSVSKNLSKSA